MMEKSCNLLVDDGEGVNFDWTRAGPVGEQPEMMNRAWVGLPLVEDGRRRRISMA